MQGLALGLVEPHEVYIGPLLKLCKSLSRASRPSGMTTTPHSLLSSANLLRVHLISLSMSLMKMLNSSSPCTDPWGTPLVTGIHLDIEPLTPMVMTGYWIKKSIINLFHIWGFKSLSPLCSLQISSSIHLPPHSGFHIAHLESHS